MRVTRRRTFITKSKVKVKGKKNKVLPKLKCSFIAQMVSVEKEMMDGYNEEKKKKKI